MGGVPFVAVEWVAPLLQQHISDLGHPGENENVTGLGLVIESLQQARNLDAVDHRVIKKNALAFAQRFQSRLAVLVLRPLACRSSLTIPSGLPLGVSIQIPSANGPEFTPSAMPDSN